MQQRRLEDVVDEGALTLDLHDREPFAIGRLELGNAADVDLLELERLLLAHPEQNAARTVAERAAGRVVERDARYG